MAFPHRMIAARLREGDATKITEEVGAALEDVVGWTLCSLPGIRILHRDFTNRANSMELDLFLFNNHGQSPLDFLPSFLIVQCKNWTARVDSATVREFVAKLHAAHQKVGILVAANGVTGDFTDQTAANDIIRQAFDLDDMKIIILTRAEIESLRSQRDIVLLLEQKYGTACLRSTTLK